jgi:outer membrane protein assembly factor BamB
VRFNIADGTEAQWWQFTTGGGIYAGVAAADGAVYFESDDGTLYALDIETGDERWTYSAGGSFDSVPAIADGLVYAALGDGRVDTLGTAFGDLAWRSRPLPEGLSVQNPVIAGEMMFAYQWSGSRDRSDSACLRVRHAKRGYRSDLFGSRRRSGTASGSER